jgi:hypothetical protein
MKVYAGRRTPRGTKVTVDGKPLDAKLGLLDFQADGFEWGYEGSGPSQLALAILSDYGGDEMALRNYRDFTHNIIAEIEDDEWTLTSEDIEQKAQEVVIVPMDLKTLMRKVRGEID